MNSTDANISSSHWGNRAPYLLFILSIALFAANPFSLLDFPLDDAWIHRVYSQSFAYGHGFEYNPEQQEAGSTSPLWSIITAPAHWLEPLGIDVVVLAIKAIGLMLALGTLRATKYCGKIIGQSNSVGIFAATLLALDPRLAFSALSGMETTLLMALWIGSTAFLLNGRFVLATVLISLAPTARPEALVILPFFALAAIIAAIRNKMSVRRLWAALCILPIPMALWSLFCQYANGHWLPTPFYMKSTPPGIGAEQFSNAWKLLGLNGPLPSLMVVALVVLAGFFLIRRNRNPEYFLLLLAAPFAFLFGVLFSREFLLEGYYWLRWADPSTMLLTATAALALGIILSNAKDWKIKSAVAVVLLLSLPHLAGSFTSWRNRLISDSRAINLITIQAGRWINKYTPEDAVIGVNDAGATRYFGKRRTIDLMGLNCADIAFNRIKPEDTGIIEYLAITPTWFYGKGIYDNLPVCTNFSIPPAEYTITSNKGQAEIVIFRVH